MLSQSVFDNQELLSNGLLDPSHTHNVTHTVRVPSSEHVAEIVGRQGCKIKALRAKTNTYIKTPVRGSEPLFIITGRREDVDIATEEIESSAAHFSSIRSTKHSSSEGIVTGFVRVPYKVVGLVVGQRGITIKRIQQETNTYIVTPSRDKDPVFEISGREDDVTCAFDEIKTHVRIRTGNVKDDVSDSMTLNIDNPNQQDIPSQQIYDPLYTERVSYDRPLFPYNLQSILGFPPTYRMNNSLTLQSNSDDRLSISSD